MRFVKISNKICPLFVIGQALKNHISLRCESKRALEVYFQVLLEPYFSLMPNQSLTKFETLHLPDLAPVDSSQIWACMMSPRCCHRVASLTIPRKDFFAFCCVAFWSLFRHLFYSPC